MDGRGPRRQRHAQPRLALQGFADFVDLPQLVGAEAADAALLRPLNAPTASFSQRRGRLQVAHGRGQRSRARMIRRLNSARTSARAWARPRATHLFGRPVFPRIGRNRRNSLHYSCWQRTWPPSSAPIGMTRARNRLADRGCARPAIRCFREKIRRSVWCADSNQVTEVSCLFTAKIRCAAALFAKSAVFAPVTSGIGCRTRSTDRPSRAA
jgi:hypothetical protein